MEAGKSKTLEEYLLKVHWTVERIVASNNVDFSLLIIDMKDVSYLQFLHKKCEHIFAKSIAPFPSFH